MLHLGPNERVLLVMRRHWVTLARATTLFVALLLAPSLFLAIAPTYLPLLSGPGVRPIVNFFLALYLLGLLASMLITWVGYYLDVWIITTERIIDIEQHGLFHREVSEIAVDRVQNVTVETPGFIATALGFGNVKIQTAGEGEFTISAVTECERAQRLILERSGRQGVAASHEMPNTEM